MERDEQAQQSRDTTESEGAGVNQLPENERPSHYVAIGASAGGLEALELFFENMRPDNRLAFIVVQHLSPHYKSLMVEILSKRTTMGVHRAEDGMAPRANNVYLIPPKKNLTIFHGKLLLSEQEHGKGINLPIDLFLRSLAEDQGEKAVAIVLSGTGSDGMRGIRAIKESGGMVMVQDVETAKFDGMPRSAISTGLADFILPPERMPEQLLRFVQYPLRAISEGSDAILSEEDNLTRIFALLREKTTVDFTFYKPSTVIRRIQRRMGVNQIHELRDYVRLLEKYPREVVALHRELLIGVTNFFRDPDAFELLYEKVLPKIFDNKSGEEIRIWVPACSSGEEAYSMAILCQQYMEDIGKVFNVKIFATDIDREAVERAGQGIYTESIAADLSPERLQEFFLRNGDSYQVCRKIREMVVFAPHNILRDPPFTRIDLISCRNLLIYLQPVLQKKALSLFGFSLHARGFLLLGSCETVGEMSNHFELIDSKWKIYRNRGQQRAALGENLVNEHAGFTGGPRGAGQRPAGMGRLQAAEEDRLLERILNSVSGTFLPPGVVVNEESEIVHVIGDVRDFFSMPPGRTSMEAVKMADKDLSIPLATGMHKALGGEELVRYNNVSVERGGETRNYNLRFVLLPEKKGQERLVAVFFEKQERHETAEDGQPVPRSGQQYDLGKEAQQRIADLEQELQYTKENLQATIEELETSNEELQATNEELLASNEELYTVNAEYQSKIMELSDLNNDIDNLLQSTQIGTIFLDDDLRIRKYTPSIQQIITLEPHDVGRPFDRFNNEVDGLDLGELARRVRDGGDSEERELRAQSGKWFLLRTLPYRVTEDLSSGVVLTFIDIDALKRAESSLLHEQHRLETVTATTSSGVLMFDKSGRIVFANKNVNRMFGLDESDTLARSYNSEDWKATDPDGKPIPPQDFPFRRSLDRKEEVRDFVCQVQSGAGRNVLLKVNSSPILNEDGTVDGVVQTIVKLEQTE